MSSSRPPGARLPLSSITRELPASELAALIDKTRPREDTPRAQEEADTAAMGGDEMDALLAPERASPSSPAAAPGAVAPPEAAPISVLPPGAARMVVPPTHVPLAPIPSRLSEPTVVLTADLFPTAPAAPTFGAPAPTFGAPPAGFGAPPAPTFGAPPPSFGAPGPTFGAPPAGTPAPGPVSSRADVPVWAQTQLAPSRKQVRAARNTKLFLGVAALALLTGSAGAAFVMLRKGSSDSGQMAPPSGQAGVSSGQGAVSSGQGGVPSGTSGDPSRTSGSPSRTSGAPPAAPGTPEFEARDALTRLREGLGACVRDVIHVLPGTSPAVPEKLAALRGGAYKGAARDFRSPVFSCLKYRETKPQRFQIQWQVTMQPSEGRGVAWLDDDGDGKADRALSFRAKLVRRGEVELGEIEPLTPVPDVLKPRP